MDIQKLRREYEDEGIHESELPHCPIELFRQWFADATENCPGDWFETNAMSLATSASDQVSVRVVLLKQITDSGIRFFTNYESDKGKQMAANPNASVCFHWHYLARQVRMAGVVEKTNRQTSEEYFHSRPRGSQIGALASQQSAQLNSREELDLKARSLAEKYDGQAIPLPDQWGGYELKPVWVEFWQGRTNRLHDRFVYEKSGDSWDRFRLAP